jgi:transposase InsO family protein
VWFPVIIRKLKEFEMTEETKTSVEATVREIRRGSRKKYSAEEKMRIVLEGLRGEDTIAELCRREGVQYAATDYTELLQVQGICISMAHVGKPTENGFAERLLRTIKEEEVDLSDYEDYDQAYQQIGQFLEDVYMRKRVHSSLNYLTPVEFEAQWH